MVRRIVPALLCAALVLSFSLAARADEPGENPLLVADRIEREAQALLGQGRCGEGARLMSKAWRLRAEAWGAEMRPEPHPPRPGGPVMPLPPRIDARKPKFELAAVERAKLVAVVEQMRAQSVEMEEASKAAKAAGDEAAARERMEAARRLGHKAAEIEKSLRSAEAGEKAERERAAADEHRARMVEAKEKLVRLQAEAEEWAAKAKALAAAGHEREAVAAKERSVEAAARAEHLKQRLAGAAGTPPKDARLEKGVLEAEVRRLRAEVEDLRAQLETLRAQLEARPR
jgi:hypothetical protein